MARKYEVSIEFSLGTTVEFDGGDWDRRDPDGLVELTDESYWSSTEVEQDGGNIVIVVEADDEDDAERIAREIVEEGDEVEDGSGWTWGVTHCSYSVEAQESKLPTLDEALAILAEFGEEHREDDQWGEVARAGLRVIEEVQSLGSRVTSLEARLAEHSQRIEGLVAQIQPSA